jgi:NADH:ubiquinone oxidoreductase subunit 5 (subunit L)/multisubunit Na+/H+ antiporter MnhA subunit
VLETWSTCRWRFAGADGHDDRRLPGRLAVLYPPARYSRSRWRAIKACSTEFLLNKWYFDEIYDFLFVRPTLWLGRLFWKGGDGFVIDGFGPDGVSARVLDVTATSSGCRPATSITTPSPC